MIALLRKIFLRTPYFVLTRISDDGVCTEGILEGMGLFFHTMERPWLGNEKNISCIPKGVYRVVPHGWDGEDVKFRQSYKLLGTEPRTAILIHHGNFVKDVKGCILIGTGSGVLGNERAVLSSVRAMNELRSKVGKRGFILEIR